VGLLAGFELGSSAGPIHLPVSAQRVVAFLALHERPLTRAFIAGSLWPEVSDERALACLRSALWRGRRTGIVTVDATADRLQLATGVGIDVAELMADARRLDAGLSVDHPRSLIEGFQWDLLPDWYDDWVAGWRERWRQVRLHALESLATLLAGQGAFALAVAAAMAAVDTEPLRESAHRTLISVHLAEGNAYEAVRQYESCSRLLRDELNAEPSQLMHAIMRA
jgi:DNA-binding SARP family transcriptional activator